MNLALGPDCSCLKRASKLAEQTTKLRARLSILP